MSETAFNRINSLAYIFKAAYNLGNVIRVSVTKTKLTILVIFTYSVHQTLRGNKESKVVTARDATYLYPITEGHSNWQRELHTLLSKRPSVRITIFSTG